jgi:hypothetical protein
MLWSKRHQKWPNRPRAYAFDPLAYVVVGQGELAWGEADCLLFAWAPAEGAFLASVSRQVEVFPLKALARQPFEFCRPQAHFQCVIDQPQSRSHHMKAGCWLTRSVRVLGGGTVVQVLPVGGPVATGSGRRSAAELNLAAVLRP